MVCPGVLRKAAKLVPTVAQALALVVCIHVVGQVRRSSGAHFANNTDLSKVSGSEKSQVMCVYFHTTIQKNENIRCDQLVF